MKRILIALTAVLFAMLPASAQSAKNSSADNIIGKYESVQGTDAYKVEVSKNEDGTYKAQIYWMKDPMDPKTGKKALDVKNPDKSLRTRPCDQIVLIQNLKYLSAKKVWGDAKIYDPQRGIKANVTAQFLPDGRLSLKATVLGIGETVYRTPVEK